MNKKNIYYILITILCFILFALSYIKIMNNSSDASKFKKEYESLNGKEAYDGQKYKKLEISANNPVKYKSSIELADIIENKTGIIYLGFPSSPWCRTMVPVLLDVLKDNNIDTLYYLNIESERDAYEIQDGKLVYSKDDKGNDIKGSKGYFELLKLLDSYLSDYIISFDGETFNVNEKRIYEPTVIFVKDGNILGVHTSTVLSQVTGYEELTNDDYKELYGIYEDYILLMNSETCDTDEAC